MARPTREDSIYRVAIHKNGGYMYATTHPYELLADGKRKYSCLHWGTVTDDLKFIPGKQYLYASIEERSKLIFPEGWDLSEIDKLASNRKQGRPAYEGEDVNRLYGDCWLLEQISDNVGLTKDLASVFDGNMEMVDDVLTLSFFPYLTGFNYSRLARWQRIAKSPSARELTPATITRLTQSITEAQRLELFRCRAARLGKDELCAVDSTSKAAWGHSHADIKWGKSKDRLPLPQTMEVVVYSLTSHMPVYYREMPGNIPDSRSVQTILTDLEHAGFPKVTLVTDRGYESLQNLEKYILKGQQMIMCVSVHQKLILDKILEFGPIDGRPGDMELDLESKLYYKQYDINYKVMGNGDTVHEADRMKLNLYFSLTRRAEDLSDIDFEIERQRRALQAILDSGDKLDDNTTIKRNYSWFNLEYNDSDMMLKSFSLNEKKVKNAKKSAGFFANMTLAVNKTAMEALAAYGLRDEQEKYFNQMKGQMHFDRQRTWSEEGKNGRLFISFVALILSSYARHIWKSTSLKDKFSSTLEVFDEMRSIRCIEHNGKAKHITPFIGAQREICEAFGIKIPEGCAPVYKSKQAREKKPGRPKKQKEVKLEY